MINESFYNQLKHSPLGAVALFLAWLLTPNVVAADEQVTFCTPSGNIECIYTPVGGTSVYEPVDGGPELSCDRVSPRYVRVVLGPTGPATLFEDVGDAGAGGQREHTGIRKKLVARSFFLHVDQGRAFLYPCGKTIARLFHQTFRHQDVLNASNARYSGGGVGNCVSGARGPMLPNVLCGRNSAGLDCHECPRWLYGPHSMHRASTPSSTWPPMQRLSAFATE